MKESNDVCNQKVYNNIFNEHAEALRNFHYYRCKDLAQAEDLVQDAFVKLWENCKKVMLSKARGFLYAVSKNNFYNQAAHQKVKFAYEKLPQTSTTIETPHYKMEEAEFMDKLTTAIDALPEGQREVFLLNRIDKKTYKEIAEMLGVSQKAIEKRMHKALSKLRLKIEGI